MRRETISFKVRDVGIGSAYPVSMQSMTNTDTHDVAATLQQVNALVEHGAALVRVAIPDAAAAQALKAIVAQSPVPIIADIHFDYRLALASLDSGVDALRINPGNIGGMERFQQVVEAAKKRQVPMRIGVNSGSIEKQLLAKYGHPCPEAMAESLGRYVEMCETLGYDRLVLSAKASDVVTMVAANRVIAKMFPYPLHLGVTEAGSPRTGVVKSAIGIGALLVDGIGDTIRVSLTGDPLNELPVAREILRASGCLSGGVEMVACPTCGRTQIDLVPLLEAVEDICATVQRPLKVAVMGCAVNGPGEAREADIGIAGGIGSGLIFRKGEVVRKVQEAQLLDAFREELEQLLTEDEYR